MKLFTKLVVLGAAFCLVGAGLMPAPAARASKSEPESWSCQFNIKDYAPGQQIATRTMGTRRIVISRPSVNDELKKELDRHGLDMIEVYSHEATVSGVKIVTTNGEPLRQAKYFCFSRSTTGGKVDLRWVMPENDRWMINGLVLRYPQRVFSYKVSGDGERFINSAACDFSSGEGWGGNGDPQEGDSFGEKSLTVSNSYLSDMAGTMDRYTTPTADGFTQYSLTACVNTVNSIRSRSKADFQSVQNFITQRYRWDGKNYDGD